jgi:purine-nucleoside phosphorylase
MDATSSSTSDRIAAAVAAIRRHWSCPATTAVILGTGLGDLADVLTAAKSVSYSDIPGFPRSTALAHKGRLVCGDLAGVPLVMLQGRCHLYEGYSLEDLTQPLRALAALGIKILIVTNAAGGLNPNFSVGDIMLIDDHINLMTPWGRRLACPDRGRESIAPTPHPLGKTSTAIDSRPLPSSIADPRRIRPYDANLADATQTASRHHNFPFQRGVYIAVTGPSYETRAEYRAFRRIGGDCVGMSTVPEVLAAAACDLRVLALSTVTNIALPDAPKTVSADEVVEVAAIARPRVEAIVRHVISESV